MKRQKRKETALWILGVGAGVAVVAGVWATMKMNQQGQLALRREIGSLEKRVVKSLRQSRTLRDQAIDVVAVGAGVVELSGSVDTSELGREAVELIDGIPGVHAVFNRMNVRSVEARLQRNQSKHGGQDATRWYGGSVGIGRRRQSPTTDPARRDDHAELLKKSLLPNREDVLSEVEEMEGTGVQIGLSQAGPFTTDDPPARPN